MSFKCYFDLIGDILDPEAYKVVDRTGVGTSYVNSVMLKFKDTHESGNFPLLPHKNTHFHSIVHELLWFISGKCETTEYLKEHGVTIWDKFGEDRGDGTRYLGPIYGNQWRNWQGVDQLRELTDGLIKEPYSRRHILTAWNVSDLPQMALPPCHMTAQFIANPDLTLDCHVYQRSADVFLGLPFNIASYALLLALVAERVNMVPKDVTIGIGNAHLYDNHRDQAEELLDRYDKHGEMDLPTLLVYSRGLDFIDKYTSNDIELVGYNPLPAIKAPLAV